MNDMELRDAIRAATDPPGVNPDIDRVRRRARALRLRRGMAVVVVAVVGFAAIALPLAELRHLGEAPLAGAARSPLSFSPLAGWTSSGGLSPASPFAEQASAAVTSNVVLDPADPDSVYPPGLTNNQIEALPTDGIAIQAQQLLFTRNPIPEDAQYPVRDLPLRLADASVGHGPTEGLPRNDLTNYTLQGLVNGRPIIVVVWIGTRDPSSALIHQAQGGLNQLVVSPAATPTDAIDEFGITMSPPAGWHTLLYAGDPTLIVSTRPITALYWDASRDALGPHDVTMTLDESDALVEVEGWAPLAGPPAIGPDERCDGCEALDDGHPPAPGHVLYQQTFTTGGRAFSLYVEFGSQPSDTQIQTVNDALATLSIQPLPNPEYTPAPGTIRVGPIYDGEDRPEVTATGQNRTLSWVYEHSSMELPAGWTGQSHPVAGLERPISLLGAGTWNYTPGGYCGPINALREMPADGAFVWVDSFGGNPPDGMTFTSPAGIDLSSAGTDPSPCFAGTNPYVFYWMIGGHAIVAHIALGPDASGATAAQATAVLESLQVG